MFPKPKRGEKKREKAQAKRVDHRVQAEARALVFSLDHGCRFPSQGRRESPCRGPDQLAHLADRTRAKTRGRPPEERHDPHYLVRLCSRHHDDYDGKIGGKKLVIQFLTDAKARGTCRFIDAVTGQWRGDG